MQSYDLTKLRHQLDSIHADSKKTAYEDGLALFTDITQIPLQHTPTRADMAVFGLCLEGRGVVEVDTRKIEFEKNNYFILFPNQVACLPEKSTYAKGIIICVSNRIYEEIIGRMQDMLPLFFYIRENPCAELPEQEVEWIKRYHQEIFREIKNPDNMFRRQTTNALLLAMLYKVCNIYGTRLLATATQSSRSEYIFTQFLHLLSENYCRHREVAWYAGKLCVTPKYMSTVIKQVSGKTANEWIQSYVLQEAKMRLSTTNDDIKQIADQLNFSSQAFFYKYFRHLTGMSPSEYRNS